MFITYLRNNLKLLLYLLYKIYIQTSNSIID